LLQDKRK